MKILAITQARISSSRLPEKVLMKLGDSTVLDTHLRRIKKSKFIDKVIVASTFEPKSNLIKEIAKKNGCDFYQGSLDDVLERFYLAAKQNSPEYVMRLTSDCPLIDPILIDDLVTKFLDSGADYASNSLNSTLPDGMDAEIFKFRALEEAFNSASLKSEREHVTPYIRNSGKFNILAVDYSPSLGNIRLTLDTIEDYNLINSLIERNGENASMQSYVDTVMNNPELKKLNSNSARNEGYLKSLKEDKDVKSNN